MALGREMSTPTKLQYEYGTLYLFMRPSSLGGGPHSVCLSVCLSVRPVIVFVYFFTVEPSYERTSKIEKNFCFRLWASVTYVTYVCSHAQRAAYRTAISAAQILVYFYTTVQPTVSARNLGVLFDADLSLAVHVNQLTARCYSCVVSRVVDVHLVVVHQLLG